MKSRGSEDSKNVKTSQAYFFEGFISFFEDFSLTISFPILKRGMSQNRYIASRWLEQTKHFDQNVCRGEKNIYDFY